jgi:hypothetical protein
VTEVFLIRRVPTTGNQVTYPGQALTRQRHAIALVTM